MFRQLTIAAVASAALTGAAMAQTVGLATTQGGATEQIATAIARTVSQATDLQMRPQMLANTSQYIPLVNDGRVEFGIANFPQTYYAIQGTGMSQGQPAPNLKMVASLIPFNAGMMVPSSLGIDTLDGLRGKRVPRFPANSLGDFIIRASLATAGLTYDDVTSVPTANFPAQFQAFRDGASDLTIATAGAQYTYEFDTLLGGVTFLNYKEGDETVLAEELPGTSLKPIGTFDVPGVSEDTVIFAYDYMLFAHADVADEVVAKVARALYEGQASLQETGPIWTEFDPATIGKSGVLEYHPGAIEYYKSVGIWSGD